MKKSILYLLFLAGLFSLRTTVNGQPVVINEIVSSNQSGLLDEDGNPSDWIELFNAGSQSVNLAGYALSDDPADKLKWGFSDVTIDPYGHLLVFLSGKDRKNLLYYNGLIQGGDFWQYIVPTDELPANWHDVGFDDQSWNNGPSGFGYGDADDATILPYGTISVFARKSFTIDDPTSVAGAFLNIDYDDGYVAYINGVEVARMKIGTPGTRPAFDEITVDYTEPVMCYGGYPDKIDLAGIQSILRPGENVLAIQCHNNGAGSSDMTLIPFLTTLHTNPPAGLRSAPAWIHTGLSPLHTNFKLNAGNDTLFFSDAFGDLLETIIDSVKYPDASYGRKPDGTTTWSYFLQPTPGGTNATPSYTAGSLGIITMSPLPGIYSATQQSVTLTTSNQADQIYYTLDGSEPDPQTGLLYSNAIILTQPAVIKAMVFNTGQLPGQRYVGTYVIGRDFDLPVVSIATHPENLWSSDSGIYVLGPNASTQMPNFGANFWEDWEKPASLEFFETGGKRELCQDVGIKIFGGWSRRNDQKSLSVMARAQYGDGDLDYRFFPNRDQKSFESIILRNAGSDWEQAMCRDGLLTSLIDHVDLETQAYRPAVLFLNGEYWGVQNIREKVNEHYLAEHKGVHPDSLDLLEYDGRGAIHGSSTDYNNMIRYLERNSLAGQTNYQYISSLIDIPNFIQYQLCQIYFGNDDWPGSNIKFWKSSDTGNKWRWILFDVDFGFGLYGDSSNVYENNIDFALEPDGPGWPNPPWSTLIFRKMVENQDFVKEFVNYFADHLNTSFQPDRVLVHIDKTVAAIQNEMPYHKARWPKTMNYSQWLNEVQTIRWFGQQRMGVVRNHILSEFNLPAMHTVEVDVFPTSAGRVKLNSLTLATFPWDGIYYEQVPISLTAIAKPGFRFTGWTGVPGNPTEETVELSLTDALTAVAHFVADASLDNPLVINEINYHSSPSFDSGDWVEFYNRSGGDLDISGWVFRDSNPLNGFVFPRGTIIAAEGYLILCRDKNRFKTLYPGSVNFIGDLSFNLSNGGESIAVYDQHGILIDSVSYLDTAPWPETPDGFGPTLELLDPDMDNLLASSWDATNTFGSPEIINDVRTHVNEKDSETYLFQNYPNPAVDVTNTLIFIPRASNITLDLVGLDGRLVQTIYHGSLDQGYHTFTWATISLNKGLYLVRLHTGEKVYLKKASVLR